MEPKFKRSVTFRSSSRYLRDILATLDDMGRMAIPWEAEVTFSRTFVEPPAYDVTAEWDEPVTETAPSEAAAR
jgi:hypothetical protein